VRFCLKNNIKPDLNMNTIKTWASLRKFFFTCSQLEAKNLERIKRKHHTNWFLVQVPISVAYKRGLFDKRMNEILEDPSDDTKGFFDPNTEENLSYLDLMQR